MTIEILAFGIVKDIFGGNAIKLEADEGITTVALKKVLEEKYPGLRQLASFVIALNNEYARDEQPIHEHDEIAIIPPVSGG